MSVLMIYRVQDFGSCIVVYLHELKTMLLICETCTKQTKTMQKKITNMNKSLTSCLQ